MKKLLFTLGVIFLTTVIIAQPTYQWAKSMGAAVSAETGSSVAVDAAGNVYNCGFFFNTVDFDPGVGTANLTSAGLDDIYITKFDAAGNFQWAQRFGSTGTDYGRSVTVDVSGNVYLTGSVVGTVDFDSGVGVSNVTGAAGGIPYILKLDGTGTFQWVQSTGTATGGAGYSIKIAPSGSVYVGGIYSGNIDFDPTAGTNNYTATGGPDGFILKLDATGAYVWGKGFVGSSADYLQSIAIDASENIYASGDFIGTVDFDPNAGTQNLTSAGSDDGFILKLTSAGNYVWARKVGSTGGDFAYSLAVNLSGNVFVTGYFSGTVDFDPGAGTSNLVSVGAEDAFILTLDTDGMFLDANKISGTSSETGNSIALDASGNIYVGGTFSGTTDFDPSAGTSNLTSNGSDDLFIAKYNSSYVLQSAQKFGSTGGESFYELALSSDLSIHATGYFVNTVDFDPGAGTVNLISNGSRDAFVLKLSQSIPLPTDFGVTASPSSICTGSNSTITIASSQIGVQYTLRDNTTNAIIAGPTAGTGAAINFNTGALTTTYNVLAETIGSSGAMLFEETASSYSTVTGFPLNVATTTGGFDFSLEFWLKFNDNLGVNQTAIEILGHVNTNTFLEVSDNGVIYYRLNGTNTARAIAGSYPMDGLFHHVALVYDPSFASGSRNIIYIDGVAATLDLNVDITAAFPTSTGFLIGRIGTTPDYTLDGVIDELRMWSDARTSAEILANKNGVLVGNEAGLVAYYNYEAGSGTAANDITGNGYNSTLINTTNANWVTRSGVVVNSLVMSVTPTVTVSSLPATPTITAGGSTTFCAGGSVILTSSMGTSYLWSNGATTAAIFPTLAGTYSVQVTNAAGCQSPASAGTIVTVNALPATPTITAGGSTTFCAGGSVTLTSSVGTSYLWSNGATTAAISPTLDGTYSVQVTNAAGCQSAASAGTVVTANALPATPTITAGGSTTFCAGGSVTLTSSMGTSYLWSNGATTAAISPTLAGTYSVQVTNAAGCQSPASAGTVVTVNALPATPTITTGGSTTFCAGGSVTLTSSTGTSYLWSNGATTAAISPTLAGTYSVQVTNAAGCQSASSAGVTTIVGDFTDPDMPILVDISSECFVSPTAPTTTDNCAGTITGTTTTIFPITAQGTTIVTWLFDDGNGNVITIDQNVLIDDVTAPAPSLATLPTINATCSLNFLTTPAATDNCSGTVTVTSDVVLPITLVGTTIITWYYEDENGNISTQTQDVVIAPIVATTTTLNNVITANASDSYIWINCATNQIIAGETAQSYTPTVNGTYAVLITQGLCSDTSECVIINSIGIKESISLNSVNVFPNPTRGEITFEFSENYAQLEIMDAQGKVIRSMSITNGEKVSISSYENGVYFLRINTETGTSLHRIVKN